jgi:hypothetical protein
MEIGMGLDSTTVVTAVAPPRLPQGSLFYTKLVTIPPGANVLFVTFSGTGNVGQNPQTLWLACVANSSACTTEVPAVSGLDGAPPGWITLQNFPINCPNPDGTGLCRDNGIFKRWCSVIPPRTQKMKIDLRMATSRAGPDGDTWPVSIEKWHVFIDAAQIPSTDRCARVPRINSSADDITAGLAAAAAAGDKVVDTIPRTRTAH